MSIVQKYAGFTRPTNRQSEVMESLRKMQLNIRTHEVNHLKPTDASPYTPSNFGGGSKQKKYMTTTLSAQGFKFPLKHAAARNKRGGVSARERGTSQSRPPPTRLSAAKGPSCFVGRPSLLPFLAVQERESPAGIPHQNQRAEGTKKIFLTLLSTHGGQTRHEASLRNQPDFPA
jgi:hypothetical protein